ncbi:MAG: glycoside hydrolase family 28 protein [Bacteroidetes bacterium]|nr:glycoside hydrolase family 28 protein [Bacteroidota bacterium]
MIRMFLTLILLTGLLGAQQGPVDPWRTAEEITARVRLPYFPDRSFDVTSFGAKGDGRTMNSAAFRRAIDSCSRAGGGRVTVPPGEYLTGAIRLRSNVNLSLAKGAVIRFSTNPSDYLPLVLTRWEGMEVMNYSPLIYAYGDSNIAVTGEGVLDGQGSTIHWWPWKGNKEDGWKEGMPRQKEARARLMEMVEQGVPAAERIFGDGSYLRPSFFQPYHCRNVAIVGVTLRDSPMWFINPVLCTGVLVERVTVIGLGPNNDGCNPESSKDVVIRDCLFDTGDDCIAIKSGRNADGRRINVPSENIVVTGCTMKEGHGGVVLGSELSGGIRNVFVQDCIMSSPHLDRALRFKTNSVRGGVIENFYARRITVGEVREAVILVDYHYEEGDAGRFDPVMRTIVISDLTATKGRHALFVRGYARAPITGLVLTNCTFDGMEQPDVIEHVQGLRFENVRRNGRLLSAP